MFFKKISLLFILLIFQTSNVIANDELYEKRLSEANAKIEEIKKNYKTF